MELTRACDDISEHLTMRAMDAVKVADGDDGRAEICRYLLEAAEDLHQISNSSLRFT